MEYNELWDTFCELQEILGNDTLLNNIYGYFGNYEMEKCISSIISDYDLEDYFNIKD